MYRIGHKIWFKGDEATVTTAPYELHGAMWQNAIITDTGKIVTIPTPEQVEANAKKVQAEWRKQKNEFSKLRKTTDSQPARPGA